MRIIEKMVQQEMVTEEDKEWVEFGLRQSVHILCNWGIVICLGFLFHLEIWQSLFFYLSYCIIRVFAGGYHSKSRTGCYLCSMICIMLAFLIYHQITVNKVVCCLLYMSAVSVIMCYSPLDNPSKRLSIVERARFRKVIKKLMFFYSFIFIGTVCLSWYEIYALMMLAVLFAGVMVFIGLLQKNKSVRE